MAAVLVQLRITSGLFIVNNMHISKRTIKNLSLESYFTSANQVSQLHKNKNMTRIVCGFINQTRNHIRDS